MEGFSEGLIVLAYVNSVTGSIYAELHEMSIVFGLLKINVILVWQLTGKNHVSLILVSSLMWFRNVLLCYHVLFYSIMLYAFLIY